MTKISKKENKEEDEVMQKEKEEVEEQDDHKMIARMMMILMRRRRSKGGGLKTIVPIPTQPLLVPQFPPFLRYQPPNHELCYCRSPNDPLRVKIKSQYFTDIFYTCMQTMCILFMAPTHVFWKLQYSTKLLVKLGFLLAGRKKTCFDPLRMGCGYFFLIFSW